MLAKFLTEPYGSRISNFFISSFFCISELLKQKDEEIRKLLDEKSRLVKEVRVRNYQNNSIDFLFNMAEIFPKKMEIVTQFLVHLI